MLDEDGRPLPPRPWEPPGPPPKRKYVESARWFFVYVLVGVAVLALVLFMCVTGPFGVSPG